MPSYASHSRNSTAREGTAMAKLCGALSELNKTVEFMQVNTRRKGGGRGKKDEERKA